MRRLIPFLMLLSVIPAFSQASVLRWDTPITTINQSAPIPPGLYPVLAIPNSTIQICATWTTGVAACNSLAQTYTDSTGVTACSTATQLTPSLGGACTQFSDAEGGAGAWLPGGQYAYVVTASYGTFGPYVFSVGAIAGGVFTGSITGPGVTSNINNQINVMAPPYNAQCNAAVFSGTSITQGTSTLTGTGFTAALVGRKIILWGAGTQQANGSYFPIVTTVQAFNNSTSLTLATTATNSIPNVSNPSGYTRIGTDDTSAVQSAINAASATNSTVYFPAPLNGNSCMVGAINSFGTGVGPVPIQGAGSIASFVSGLPGQDVFSGRDGVASTAAYSFLKGITIYTDSSEDVSGASGSFPNRYTGTQALQTAAQAAITTNQAVCTAGTCAITLNATAGNTILPSVPVTFQGCTGGLAPLNYTSGNRQVFTTLASPAPTQTTFSITTGLISGTISDTSCLVSTGMLLGSQTNPLNPQISPGPVNFTGGTVANVSPGVYSLTFANGNNTGGDFANIPFWYVIGQPVSIPASSITGTISQVISNNQAYFTTSYAGGTLTSQVGTWGAGNTPPWYIGNCGYVLPATDGNFAGGPQMMLEDVTFLSDPATPAFANHTCGLYTQKGVYFWRVTRFTAQNLYAGFIEALPDVNVPNSFSSDTATFHDMNLSVSLGYVMYTGNHRILDGFNVYAANHPFALAGFALTGPLNTPSGTVTHYYHECWSPNSGENQRWQGGPWAIVGGALTQCGGPQVYWQAKQSNVSNVSIGNPTSATATTAGLQIFGNMNSFLNLQLAATSIPVNDLGQSNTVTSTLNASNGMSSPTAMNRPQASPGIFDGSFLEYSAAAPYTSNAGLILDQSTGVTGGAGASTVTYSASAFNDGNPAPGYWVTSSGNGAYTISAPVVGQPFAVCQGCRIPPSSTVYVVTGLQTANSGTWSMTVRDVTASTTLTTCNYIAAGGATFYQHGGPGSADACSFNASSVPAGDIINYGLPSSSLGNQKVGYIALEPMPMDAIPLPNGSTATTQSPGDNTTKAATDAFVESAVSGASGVVLNYAVTGALGGGTITAPNGNTFLGGVVFNGSGTYTAVTYNVQTPDNSANLYDIGLYNSSGTLICHLGATAGTSFSPSAGVQTRNWASSCTIAGGSLYYVAFTGNAATAVLLSGNNGASPKVQATTTGGTTTGGVLNGSVTAPTASWTTTNATGSYIPFMALHN